MASGNLNVTLTATTQDFQRAMKDAENGIFSFQAKAVTGDARGRKHRPRAENCGARIPDVRFPAGRS
jgi:hypothetical protein